ncbi:hypothetical protein L0337_20300 [candidate division KSB1 bacterium]|nr:hypothetical protein [candidate division KSB1 bacterium]
MAPTATTKEATEVSDSSATLNGEVNPGVVGGLGTTVEFEYGATTSYGNKMTADQSPVLGLNPVQVSVKIAGLLPNTTYHFHVVARNTLGTDEGADLTFTTDGVAPTVTTNAASNVSATSATLNGAVNANGLSTTVKFEYGTTTDYGDTASATLSPDDGRSLVAVSAEISGLLSSTEYYYRVVATNSVGRSEGERKTFQTGTTGSAPAVTTDAAAEVCSTSATLRGTVNPNGLNTTVIFEYGTTTSYGDTATTPSPVAGTNLVSVRTAISNLSPGAMYHYRVVATSDGGTSIGNDQAFRTYPDVLPYLITTVDFPSLGNASDYKATDYRIVGLPGASDRTVNEFFAGQQNEDWEVVWDNGAPTNFFVRFDGGADFKFSAGRAFWVIKKGPLEINTTARSAPLDSCQFVSIPLRPGWNLVTNPFTTPIQWSVIQSVNGITGPIYSYDGAFSPSSRFDPYIGYYFFNETGPSKLKIPYSSSSAASATLDVDPAIWRVNVTLTSDEFVDKITSFGVANAANSTLDPLDFRKPRALAATPTVAFHRPTWDAQYSVFATDIRPEIVAFESWEFEVRTVVRNAAQLTFSGIAKIPASYEAYVIDEGRARTLNLREDSLYRFIPAAEISKFSVMVGKKDAVQEKLSAVVLPKEFTLGQNYPNPYGRLPFNPETTIPLAVPMTSEVKLVVYNTLGREVKTIYRGTLPAGRYWFTWEGKDEAGNPLATGVYFYRLTTGTNVALLGKMLVIR